MRSSTTVEEEVWGHCSVPDQSREDDHSETTDHFPSGLLTPTSTAGTSRNGYRSFTTGATVGGPDLTNLSSRHFDSDFEDVASTASSYISNARSSRSAASGRTRRSERDTSTSNTTNRPHNAHQIPPEPDFQGRLQAFKKKLCLLSLIPVALFLLVFLAGYLLLIWPGGTETQSNTAIDTFLSTQDEWVQVHDLISPFDYLPAAVKQGESEMIGVMLAIKHSHLRGRDRLVSKMEQFATLSSSISSHANSWNALAGSSMDRVQNMNYHALRALQTVQKSSAPWPVIPTPSYGTIGVIAHVQSFAHTITSALAQHHEQRMERLHTVISTEADKIATDLETLRVSGTRLHGELELAVAILYNIAEIARNEAFLAAGDQKDLEASFWQWFGGFYSKAIANLGEQVEYLEGMAGAVMVTHKIMGEVMTKVEGLDEGFGSLQTALKETEWKKSAFLDAQLGRIQMSIERLERARGSVRGGSQRGRLHGGA